LLLEAHDRRAFAVLDYSSWEQYVQREFRLSRSRSYELLDQGRIILAVKEAAGLADAPDISAYAATQIKPYLGDVLQAVRSKVEHTAPEHMSAAVSAIIREWRSRIVGMRSTSLSVVALEGGGAGSHPPPGLASQGDLAVEQRPGQAEFDGLYDAVERLATMAPAGQIVSVVPGEEAYRLRDVATAARWLSEFAGFWSWRQQELEAGGSNPGGSGT
jgi:hypothetical protein